nr:hypothetical protein [Tanacetum cinerariifolium]
MMLLARAITQKFSTPTNNRLRTSSNTRNQVVIRDGRVDIQTKNAGYGRNGNRNAGRQNKNQAFNARNGLTQNDESHYACDCQKPRVHDAKYFKEQILLAVKDEAGSNLKDEENDFMLDNSYGDDTLKELTAAIIMMARIQPPNDNVVIEPNYDAKAISEETLEDMKERGLKMRNKMIQLDYRKLNALYETFVPKKEPSVKQTYFSIPSTSNVCSKSNEAMSESSNSVRRPKSKNTKSKNRVLKNTNDKISSTYVRKVSSSVRIDSNKCEITKSTESQSNVSVLNTKTVNVVNDSSNIVCVSCGKDVFMLSHEKFVARYALSIPV